MTPLGKMPEDMAQAFVAKTSGCQLGSLSSDGRRRVVSVESGESLERHRELFLRAAEQSAVIGLGTAVAWVAKATGLATLVGPDCGCQEREAALNRLAHLPEWLSRPLFPASVTVSQPAEVSSSAKTCIPCGK